MILYGENVFGVRHVINAEVAVTWFSHYAKWLHITSVLVLGCWVSYHHLGFLQREKKAN